MYELTHTDVLTDTQRADLARWVVAMRRAHAAGTPQTKGNLHDERGYCCLGLWCVVAEARGVLERHVSPRTWCAPTKWRERGGMAWHGGNLPPAAHLAGSADPTILRDLGLPSDEPVWFSASHVNDDLGLRFDQIADLVVRAWQLTPAELAAAEQLPRVPEIEGSDG